MPHRKIGFELELTPLYDEVEELVENCVTSVPGQTFMMDREEPEHWTLKDEHTGMELTSPALESSPQNFVRIGDVITNLRNRFRRDGMRGVVEDGCGFHVHIDLNDLNARQLRNMMRMFIHFESALLSIQPRYRQRESHVTLLRNHVHGDSPITEETNVRHRFPGHGTAVNFCRYDERRTCEIRWAASTTKRRNVVSWIQLLVFMIEIAKSDAPGEYDFTQWESTKEGLTQFIQDKSPTTWLLRRKENIINFIDYRHRRTHPSQYREDATQTEPVEVEVPAAEERVGVPILSALPV